MAENVRYLRDAHDLLEMQDRAVRALQDGMNAMHFALQLIQQMVAERGDEQRLNVYRNDTFGQSIPARFLYDPNGLYPGNEKNSYKKIL